MVTIVFHNVVSPTLFMWWKGHRFVNAVKGVKRVKILLKVGCFTPWAVKVPMSFSHPEGTKATYGYAIGLIQPVLCIYGK